MPKEESIISGAKVKYKGTFDLEILYSKIREWFMDQGYSDPCENGEKKYSERIKPNGKTLEILWEASKEGENGYFKLDLNVTFFINSLNEVEVEKDGRKLKLHNCGIEVEFNSKFTENANNSWDENSFIFRIYRELGLKDRAEEFKIDLYND